MTEGAPGGHVVRGLVLQRATSRDVSEIVEIERHSFTDPWTAHAFRELVDNPRVYFVCAREDVAGPAVGYVAAWFAGGEGEITNLAVSPEARRKGVGSALLDAALTAAGQVGAAAMYLEVRDSNRAARRLYASRGFVEVGRRKAYYRRPVEDAIVLRRDVQGN